MHICINTFFPGTFAFYINYFFAAFSCNIKRSFCAFGEVLYFETCFCMNSKKVTSRSDRKHLTVILQRFSQTKHVKRNWAGANMIDRNNFWCSMNKSKGRNWPRWKYMLIDDLYRTHTVETHKNYALCAVLQVKQKFYIIFSYLDSKRSNTTYVKSIKSQNNVNPKCSARAANKSCEYKIRTCYCKTVSICSNKILQSFCKTYRRTEYG